MTMITNLFSVFDPSSYGRLCLNWVVCTGVYIFLNLSYWVVKGRVEFFGFNLLKFILVEIVANVEKSIFSAHFLVVLFFYILITNIVSLFSYVFTRSGHIVFSIRLRFPVWVGLMLYVIYFNINKYLAHLVPRNSPLGLTSFIRLIERISNIIRPITLSVRLGANIIAGHLLLGLVSGVVRSGYLYFVVFQVALVVLEVAVAFIQGYVFVVLVRLYIRELS